MTSTERLLARAIAPGMVTYVPGCSTKRFARDMAELERYSPDRELTPKQSRYLAQVAVRFRRQIPRDIVDQARRVLAEMEATQ